MLCQHSQILYILSRLLFLLGKVRSRLLPEAFSKRCDHCFFPCLKLQKFIGLKKIVLSCEWQVNNQHLVGRPANKQEIRLLLVKVGTSSLLSLILLVTVYFNAVFLFHCLSLPIPASQLVTTGVMVSLELLQFKAIVPVILSLTLLMVLRFEELGLCMG